MRTYSFVFSCQHSGVDCNSTRSHPQYHLSAEGSTKSSEVGSSETTGTIPAFSSSETLGTAATVVTLGNVIEGSANLGVTVQTGVEETKSRLALRHTVVVDQGDERGEEGRRGRGTGTLLVFTVKDDGDSGTNGRDIGVGTASGADLGLNVGRSLGQPLGDIGLLVVGLVEQGVGEARARGTAVLPDSNLLRAVSVDGGSSNTGDVWADSGEVRDVVLAGLALVASAVVTGREEDGDTAGAGLGKLVADTGSVAGGGGGLVSGV